MRVGANVIVGRAQPTNLTTASQNIILCHTGSGALTTGSNNVFIGSQTAQSLTTGSENVLIGFNAGGSITSSSNIAIGTRAGETSQTSTSFGIIIGAQAARFGSVVNSIVMGQSAGLNGATNSVIIGDQANSSGTAPTAAIALGASSLANSNEFAVGSASSQINTVLLGRGGAGQTSANSVRIQTMKATGADIDVSEGSLVIAGSQSTGAVLSGEVIIATAPPGSAGSTLNTHVPRIRGNSAGNVRVLGETTIQENLQLSLGKSLIIPGGNNATAGLATITNGTAEVTVTTSACYPESVVLVTNQTSTAYVSVTTKQLGSFKIAHANNVGADQQCAWFIINPGDIEALNFINTAAITDNTQKQAILTLVSDLKRLQLWDKLVAVYPFVGGTASANSYNLKNTAQYQITWSGTITHDSNGITSDGTTGYGDLNLSPLGIGPQNSQHISIYSRTTNTGTFSDLQGSSTAPTSALAVRSGYAINSSIRPYTAISNGLHTVSRLSSGILNIYRNGSFVFGDLGWASSTPSNVNYFISAANNAGVATNISNRNYAFASVGIGLTTDDVANLYTAVQAFQTTLGRQV